MKHVILVHYHEIALKGGNRGFFEAKLRQNIANALEGLIKPEAIKRERGLLVVDLGSKKTDVVLTRLQKVFGVAYLAPGLQTKTVLNDFYQGVAQILNNKKFTSFRVNARRADKKFPHSSQEINEKVGRFVQEEFKKKVDLTNPDLTVYLEILPEKTFVYSQKVAGPGGLPVGTAGKTVSLISAGFDSPVAAWSLIKRGAKTVFVHFHSHPFVSKDSIDQVRELVQVLTDYQFSSSLYLVPFAPIQKQIATKCPSSLRVILYRRMMIRIGEMIARREDAKALVTGESLGQVASQTLVNIKVIDKVATMPIFRPLIGMDKQEIINQAKKIGTHDVSVKPYDDCCSFLLPRQVAIAANIKEVEEAEKALDFPKLIKNTLSKTEKQKFSSS